MAEEDTEIVSAVTSEIDEFANVGSYVASEPGLQIALIVLGVGLAGIFGAYFALTRWVSSQKFHYARPFLSLFVQYAIIPLFAIALVTSINAYISSFQVFEGANLELLEGEISPRSAFVKIIDSINIIVIGWTVAHLLPIIIMKHQKSKEEEEDFEKWKDMGGFPDDGDLFHRIFKWIPPKTPPEEIEKDEFEKYLKTEDGRLHLENFRTTKGQPIGSYEKLIKEPFEEFKKSERAKYEKYFDQCTSGNNDSGQKLLPGKDPEEIYPIDTWREEKRMGGFPKIIPGGRPPGYAKRKRKNLPKSFIKLVPIGIFVAVVLGVLTWWGVDLFVLATATGGLAIGVGLALQETMQNYFAYILIRKDKIFVEGDRIKLDTGYNGYVHRITSRVTYVRDALNESVAIVPTRSLINAQVINYTKEEKMVPAVVEVGVSYLNNPRQVAAILVKVGKRAMKESVDDKGRHLIRQVRCPYVDEYKASCGCDKNLHVDINQPKVRFNQFNDSSLDFAMWVYVRDYGAQFKVKTDLRMIMYEEFKKYDIRIPWPIRTIYQGDEKREAEEIGMKKDDRKKVIDEYGLGDIVGGGDEGD